MKTDINVLVQEAVLDCANPAGIFQKLYTTLSDLTSPIDQGSEIQKRLLDEGLTVVMPVPKNGVPHQEITGDGAKMIGLILIETTLDHHTPAIIESLVLHKPELAHWLTDGWIDILLGLNKPKWKELFLCGLILSGGSHTPRAKLFLEATKNRKA